MKHLPLFWNFWAEILHKKKARESPCHCVCCNSFFGNFLHIITIFIVVGVMMTLFKDRDHLRGVMTEFFFIISVVMTEFFSGYCTHRIRLQNSKELFWAFIDIQLNSFCWFGFTDVVLLHPLLFNKLAHKVFVVVQILLHHFQQLWKGFVSC